MSADPAAGPAAGSSLADAAAPSSYTGWPTQQNPYDTGQPSGTNNGPGSGTDEVVILHLRPR